MTRNLNKYESDLLKSIWYNVVDLDSPDIDPRIRVALYNIRFSVSTALNFVAKFGDQK